MKKKLFASLFLSVLLLISACHTYKPVFYDNAHYNTVGKEQAEKDTEAAMKAADKLDLNSKTGENVKNTAKTVAIGSTSGAVSGLFFGDTWAGLACGAVWGFFVGGFVWIFGSNEPTQLYMNYVNTTLAKKGYEVIGWK
jgi:hypothetical protein